MRDIAALTRAGLTGKATESTQNDARVSVSLSQLRRLEGHAKSLNFLPRQPARSILNGRHASRLRGRGLNFEELRNYLPGDDVRSIDWKVTARTGEPHVRVYTEERDRPALIVVDQRMSMYFGSQLNMKSVTAAEAAVVAAFRILDQGDRVGGIVFGDEVITEIRPQRSRRTLDAFISAVANANSLLKADAPVTKAMSLNHPLEAVLKIAHQNHLVIVISDFDGIDQHTEKLVRGIAHHNDLILAAVTDPLAHDVKGNLKLVVSDGQLQAELDTSTDKVQHSLHEFVTGRLAEVLDWEKKFGIPILPLSAGEETVPQIKRLLGIPSN